LEVRRGIENDERAAISQRRLDKEQWNEEGREIRAVVNEFRSFQIQQSNFYMSDPIPG
jgi:hypothetical protein